MTRLLAISLILFLTPASQAAEQVSVVLNSGRTYTAAIDQRTNQESLWLRFEGRSSQIYRPIKWNSVSKITDGDKTISGIENVRAYAKQHTSVFKRPEIKFTPKSINNHSDQNDAQRAREILSRNKVQSISVEASLGNWDADVETDGLILYVSTLNQAGELVAARGTVSANLIGIEGQLHNSPTGTLRGRNLRFKSIGRWTKKIEKKNYDFRGAKFQLPFQAVHPDFRKYLRRQSTLVVTVTIPGSGVFHQSVDPVSLRIISPTRNFYEDVTGSRFLKSESTNNGSYNR